MNQKFGWTGSLTATAYCDKTAFYNGTALMGTVTQAPYSIVIPGIAAGTYQLSAQVTDGYGIMATSSVVTITVMAGSTTGTTGTEQLYDISTDQLDTPRQITDQNGTVVWSWDGEAFGSTPPNANPSGTGSFTFNLRFPGQYFDVETNLNQNAYRDYDPSTGRYVESDPLGFGGGQLSTYAYALGNPITYSDPTGNCPWCLGAAIGGAIGGASAAVSAYNAGGSFWQVTGATIGGAATGAVAGALPTTWGVWAAVGVNALAGGAGNAIGQWATGTSFADTNLSQVGLWSAIGASAGAIGWGAGFITSLSEVYGGATAEAALNSGTWVGGLSSGIATIAAGWAVPGSLGGFLPSTNSSSQGACH